VGIPIRTRVALGLLAAAGLGALTLGDDGAGARPAVTPLAGAVPPPGLEDPAPAMRAAAAEGAADPVRLPALASRLGRERDPGVIRALVRAILRLDPAGGADRVRSAVAASPGEARAAALEALERGTAGRGSR
jgi:hypothetical protein